MLAARKTYLINAHARKNKNALLASARKDHLIPLLMLAFVLQQVRAKYFPDIMQAQGYYHIWLCLASENTGFRLPWAKTIRNVQMILLVLLFALSFVFT